MSVTFEGRDSRNINDFLFEIKHLRQKEIDKENKMERFFFRLFLEVITGGKNSIHPRTGKCIYTGSENGRGIL